MAPIDWSVLIDALLTSVSDVLTSVFTAISDNADVIAGMVVGGLAAMAAVRYGGKLFKGIGSLVRKALPK
jgi:hypothetical protein